MTKRKPISNVSCAAGCGRTVKASRTGFCRACWIERFNSDEVVRERRIAGVRRYARDPDTAARRSEVARRIAASRMRNPFYVARLRKIMREVVQPAAMTPESFARRDNKARGAAQSATKLAWCPPEYRDQYRYLTKNSLARKDEARRMIMEQIELDRRRLGPDELSRAINRQVAAYASSNQLSLPEARARLLG